jgi:hypothetical protein
MIYVLFDSDLVAPTLKAPLFVETWIRGSKIPSVCPSTGYGVKNVLTLTFPPHVQFDETNDHSKVLSCLSKN